MGKDGPAPPPKEVYSRAEPALVRLSKHRRYMALSIRPMEQRPGTIGVLGTQTLDPSLLCLEPIF